MKATPLPSALLCFAMLLVFLSSCNNSEKKLPDGFCDCQDLKYSEGIWIDPQDEIFTGHCITYFADGTRKGASSFEQGLMHGTTRFYHENGIIREVVEYEKGVVNGVLTGFFPNESKEYQGEVVDGKKEGFWTNYFSNGVVESIEKYENDVMQDSVTAFFSNGSLKMKGFYIDGKMEGQWTFYDSLSGQVDGHMMYSNDEAVEVTEEAE